MNNEPSDELFARSGERGALLRNMDWARTPLGPVSQWPRLLRTAVSICLSQRFPTLVLWGPAFVLIYNHGYTSILGMKHPWAMGRPFGEVWPEVWSSLEPLLLEVVATGVASWSEDMPLHIHRRGFLEETYFTFSFAPLSDYGGKVSGIFCSGNETTEYVIAERRLRTLRELGEAALGAKTVGEACAAIARSLSHNTADITFSALYLTAKERTHARLMSTSGILEGQALSPEVISLSDENALWPLAKVARGGAVEIVAELPPRLGELPGGAWPEPTRTALVLPIVRTREEHPHGFLVAGLSPRRPLDERYRTFFELAAGQIAVAVASARSYEEERRRAESLMELDRAKTAFFSNVSHEFRTPLTLMLGPLEDARASPEKVLRGEALEVVIRNSERLLRLVNSLLDFSRIEAGRADVHYEPTALDTLTAELVSSFRSATEQAGLRLVVDCPPLPEPLYVDRDMWEMIVLNLVSNAFKFTFEGSITVRLRATERHAVLEVEDTGAGIPADELPHLFERFHRVRGARSRSFEGSGIGLALVQELVKLHGGTIAVESQVGRGTRFTVSIPRGSAHLPKEKLQVGPKQESTATGAGPYVQEALRWLPEGTEEEPRPSSRVENPSGRVLIVDDNADMRDYLQRVLAPFFQVQRAVDGLTALEAANSQRPDVIVTDVMMPGLDGLGLVQRLREDPGLRTIPILLLSAQAGPEAAVGGLDAGADDYLVKPFSARELIARVRSNLELSRMRRELFRREALEAGLREAVHARDEFLSVASHELKTPLTRFRLQMELVGRGLSEESRARVGARLETAAQTVQGLASLVETLLDVSRINTGQLHLHLCEVDLRELVTEAVEAVRDEASRAGSTLSFQGEAAVIVTCDRPRIRQVIQNLLSNAVKFGMGRPVEVSLGTQGGTARVTVADHGIGIAPLDRSRIFERFERAVSSRHYGGFGLGLWIARQVVEEHSGHITVTPTPGGGATFTLELPLDTGPA
ncbi:response regulator [Archangium violaceum]|uniref:ATP-binding protein n=1 Tax=Archangium violaceum TaxID=83451 RepID=UPI00193BAD72|nr:ATP-binding protein [Archangium violaceum]QRK11387.1 response regulator [Archangium violaceum]